MKKPAAAGGGAESKYLAMLVMAAFQKHTMQLTQTNTTCAIHNTSTIN
jgi:hypothetical protein